MWVINTKAPWWLTRHSWASLCIVLQMLFVLREKVVQMILDIQIQRMLFCWKSCHVSIYIFACNIKFLKRYNILRLFFFFFYIPPGSHDKLSMEPYIEVNLEKRSNKLVHLSNYSVSLKKYIFNSTHGQKHTHQNSFCTVFRGSHFSRACYKYNWKHWISAFSARLPKNAIPIMIMMITLLFRCRFKPPVRCFLVYDAF